MQGNLLKDYSPNPSERWVAWTTVAAVDMVRKAWILDLVTIFSSLTSILLFSSLYFLF